MKRLSDPVAFVVTLAVLAVLTVVIAVLDFTAADLEWIIAGLVGALFATAVFRLVRKG